MNPICISAAKQIEMELNIRLLEIPTEQFANALKTGLVIQWWVKIPVIVIWEIRLSEMISSGNGVLT